MLGPLEIRTDDSGTRATSEAGGTVWIGGTRLRRLLIVLALEPNRVVSSDLLIDAIWGHSAPAGAANALQRFALLEAALPSGIDNRLDRARTTQVGRVVVAMDPRKR